MFLVFFFLFVVVVTSEKIAMALVLQSCKKKKKNKSTPFQVGLRKQIHGLNIQTTWAPNSGKHTCSC